MQNRQTNSTQTSAMQADIRQLEQIFSRFYDIGTNSQGGVTRLAYTEEEDQMHEAFRALAGEMGFETYTDEVGNSYAANAVEGEYTLFGSHLDSVVNGGRYDGVCGVIAGLLVMDWARTEGLEVPLRTAAFRCEESSRFGKSTVGSALVAGRIGRRDVEHLEGIDGAVFGEVFEKRGLNLEPERIKRVKQYLELHIEQGKILDEGGLRVGIVTDIAGPRRYHIHIHGKAEHSGATPMNMRYDALCAAGQLILDIEGIGRAEGAHQSVATVGSIQVEPNVLNVTPGQVVLGVDLRGIQVESIARMETDMKAAAKRVSEERGVIIFVEKTTDMLPIGLNGEMGSRLIACAERLRIPYKVMPSGAGHDAMSFAGLCPTAMVFIPCRQGQSHNKNEFTPLESIYDGARVLYEYVKGETL
ncbi:hydantoinase/carbamoylase family amidase [Ruminococcaceae bacterium OttesenSCG-928-D13]|nr:hydantoinase/carbamoylase family amidase [Ruminococcaceae bacterium OttesenSCG-928-D13]